jgi:hypothetical protein
MFLTLIIIFKNLKYPITILSSIFLSIGGTFWLLALLGKYFTFPAALGIFGVLGVGVNQAIIHIEDFMILHDEQGMSVIESFRRSIALRFVPQGYADGYPRTLSNKGVVLVAGKRCPVVGRVAMNMFVIDVSKAPTAAEGDEVVLIGTQGKQHMSAEEVAELSGTINYEATTRISALLPRRLA